MADEIALDDSTAADVAAGLSDLTDSSSDLSGQFDDMRTRMSGLTSIANSFARAMTAAFSQSSSSGRQFENVLKSLALRLSNMAISQALRPLFSGLTGGTESGGGFASGENVSGIVPNIDLIAAMGAIKPFAAGGVIGTPTYFPLTSGGVGLAGEAGPEAILPLTRGPDGRLGVASGARAATGNIIVQIMTPDAESFRRSESYVSGQIARAVARGQRSL
jgi:lambda family phage tail tape measure protein